MIFKCFQRVAVVAYNNSNHYCQTNANKRIDSDTNTIHHISIHSIVLPIIMFEKYDFQTITKNNAHIDFQQFEFDNKICKRDWIVHANLLS